MSGFALLALGFAHPPITHWTPSWARHCLPGAMARWRRPAALAWLFDGLGHAPVQAGLGGVDCRAAGQPGGDRPAAGALVMAMLGQWG